MLHVIVHQVLQCSRTISPLFWKMCVSGFFSSFSFSFLPYLFVGAVKLSIQPMLRINKAAAAINTVQSREREKISIKSILLSISILLSSPPILTYSFDHWSLSPPLYAFVPLFSARILPFVYFKCLVLGWGSFTSSIYSYILTGLSRRMQ